MLLGSEAQASACTWKHPSHWALRSLTRIESRLDDTHAAVCLSETLTPLSRAYILRTVWIFFGGRYGPDGGCSGPAARASHRSRLVFLPS
jgi:hypothetical protein